MFSLEPFEGPGVKQQQHHHHHHHPPFGPPNPSSSSSSFKGFPAPQNNGGGGGSEPPNLEASLSLQLPPSSDGGYFRNGAEALGSGGGYFHPEHHFDGGFVGPEPAPNPNNSSCLHGNRLLNFPPNFSPSEGFEIPEVVPTEGPYGPNHQNQHHHPHHPHHHHHHHHLPAPCLPLDQSPNRAASFHGSSSSLGSGSGSTTSSGSSSGSASSSSNNVSDQPPVLDPALTRSLEYGYGEAGAFDLGVFPPTTDPQQAPQYPKMGPYFQERFQGGPRKVQLGLMPPPPPPPPPPPQMGRCPGSSSNPDMIGAPHTQFEYPIHRLENRTPLLQTPYNGENHHQNHQNHHNSIYGSHHVQHLHHHAPTPAAATQRLQHFEPYPNPKRPRYEGWGGTTNPTGSSSNNTNNGVSLSNRNTVSNLVATSAPCFGDFLEGYPSLPEEDHQNHRPIHPPHPPPPPNQEPRHPPHQQGHHPHQQRHQPNHRPPPNQDPPPPAALMVMKQMVNSHRHHDAWLIPSSPEMLFRPHGDPPMRIEGFPGHPNSSTAASSPPGFGVSPPSSASSSEDLIHRPPPQNKLGGLSLGSFGKGVPKEGAHPQMQPTPSSSSAPNVGGLFGQSCLAALSTACQNMIASLGAPNLNVTFGKKGASSPQTAPPSGQRGVKGAAAPPDGPQEGPQPPGPTPSLGEPPNNNNNTNAMTPSPNAPGGFSPAPQETKTGSRGRGRRKRESGHLSPVGGFVETPKTRPLEAPQDPGEVLGPPQEKGGSPMGPRRVEEADGPPSMAMMGATPPSPPSTSSVVVVVGGPSSSVSPPEDVHPLEILQAQIQLQRQQFSISVEDPPGKKGSEGPEVAGSPQIPGAKGGSLGGLDLEALMAEGGSGGGWYLQPNPGEEGGGGGRRGEEEEEEEEEEEDEEEERRGADPWEKNKLSKEGRIKAGAGSASAAASGASGHLQRLSVHCTDEVSEGKGRTSVPSWRSLRSDISNRFGTFVAALT